MIAKIVQPNNLSLVTYHLYTNNDFELLDQDSATEKAKGSRNLKEGQKFVLKCEKDNLEALNKDVPLENFIIEEN